MSMHGIAQQSGPGTQTCRFEKARGGGREEIRTLLRNRTGQAISHA
jgi:hypothetical protein